MNQPTRHHDLSFFVYIVESPSAPDIYHGRSEGYLIAKAIRLGGNPAVTRTVINLEAFSAALRLGLPEAMKEFPNRFPILHISAHGSRNGIQLSSGEELRWANLRSLLTPINQSLNGNLLLCMSACEGYNACQMAMQEGDQPHPYVAMIGNFGKPTWSDAAIAYSAFYHLIAKGQRIADALQGMIAASGDQSWTAETADGLKQGYLKYVAELKPTEAQVALEAAAADPPPTNEQKALVAHGGG